jgi:hypothetical protein
MPLPDSPPRLEHLRRWGNVAFWVYLLLLVVLLGTSQNKADSDLWHRFALYDFIVHTGHFPPGNAFSYQAYPQVVPDHEWGSAFIFYPVYFWGGEFWLVLLKLVTLGGTLALTVRAGLGNRAPTMLQVFFYCLVLLALLSSFLSTLRSEVFTHLFFALWVLWFQRERHGHPVAPLWYFLTMVLWANLHPGFVLGLVWMGVLALIEFFSDGTWKHRLGILALCLAATLINPFGYELWVGVFRAFAISRTAFEEWAPVPWIHPANSFSGYKLIVLWMIPVVIQHIRSRGWKRCDQTAVILLGLFLVPSLLQARQTSIFAILAGGLIPPLFPREIPLSEIREWKPWLHRVVVRSLLVILPLVLALRLLPANQGFHLVYPPDSCPIKAVEFLRDKKITGNLLVGFNSGSYAMWELRGQMRVSMDGRYEVVYPPETFANVQHFFAGDTDWKDALAALAPDAILVNLPDGVYPKLLADSDWTQAYQDATHAVFLPAAAR